MIKNKTKWLKHEVKKVKKSDHKDTKKTLDWQGGIKAKPPTNPDKDGLTQQ